MAAHAQQWAAGAVPLGSPCPPDEALLAAQLRPQVFEGIRTALDPVMRADLERLQVPLFRKLCAVSTVFAAQTWGIRFSSYAGRTYVAAAIGLSSSDMLPRKV